jgi:hypothetical protein
LLLISIIAQFTSYSSKQSQRKAMTSSTRFKIFICALQVYFLLMNFTVERRYCHHALVADDPSFLMKETYDFSVANNRLFLERPDWLRQATCIHSSIFWIFYLMVIVTALLDLWRHSLVQGTLLVFLGAKIYAVGFVHFMEFTSHVPPENLIPYFSAEGPYLISILLVLYKILGGDKKSGRGSTKLD